MFTRYILRLIGYQSVIDRILNVFHNMSDQLQVVLEEAAERLNEKQRAIDALKAQQDELYAHVDRASRIKERLDKFIA